MLLASYLHGKKKGQKNRTRLLMLVLLADFSFFTLHSSVLAGFFKPFKLFTCSLNIQLLYILV